jgi:hypothetical protein
MEDGLPGVDAALVPAGDEVDERRDHGAVRDVGHVHPRLRRVVPEHAHRTLHPAHTLTIIAVVYRSKRCRLQETLNKLLVAYSESDVSIYLLWHGNKIQFKLL